MTGLNVLVKKDEATIQRLVNVICKHFRIPSVCIEEKNTMLDTDNELGCYYWVPVKGRYLIHLNDRTDCPTAIHEVMHHLQTFLGGDITDHGHSFQKARRMICKFLNDRFNCDVKPRHFPAFG